MQTIERGAWLAYSIGLGRWTANYRTALDSPVCGFNFLRRGLIAPRRRGVTGNG